MQNLPGARPTPPRRNQIQETAFLVQIVPKRRFLVFFRVYCLPPWQILHHPCEPLTSRPSPPFSHRHVMDGGGGPELGAMGKESWVGACCYSDSGVLGSGAVVFQA
eukprot:596471-Rhodomonas_salina.1